MLGNIAMESESMSDHFQIDLSKNDEKYCSHLIRNQFCEYLTPGKVLG